MGRYYSHSSRCTWLWADRQKGIFYAPFRIIVVFCPVHRTQPDSYSGTWKLLGDNGVISCGYSSSLHLVTGNDILSETRLITLKARSNQSNALRMRRYTDYQNKQDQSNPNSRYNRDRWYFRIALGLGWMTGSQSTGPELQALTISNGRLAAMDHEHGIAPAVNIGAICGLIF